MRIFSIHLSRILIAIISFSLSFSVFAAESCSIQNGMSAELSTYITNVEALLSKIYAESSKVQCGTNKDGTNSAMATAEKTYSALNGSTNAVLWFSNFWTSGRFFSIQLKSEFPDAVKRDHESLGQEMDTIRNAYKSVYGRCAGSTIPKTNLSGDSGYDTSGKSLGSILSNILQNHINMVNFFRKTVLWDPADDADTFILVGDNAQFKNNLQNHYGPTAFEACNSQADFSKKIVEAIGRITSLGGSIEKGMSEWSKAFALLFSDSSNQEYAETERNLLRNELSKQGMSTKWSQAIMNNLATYNSQNSPNGITGFLSSIGDRAYNTVAQFGTVFDDIKKQFTKPEKPISTVKYMEIYKHLQSLKGGIQDEIIQDYMNVKSLIGPENQTADTMVAKLIDTHLLLISTNQFITPYIKLAEKTCNAQDTWNGNCTYK